VTPFPKFLTGVFVVVGVFLFGLGLFWIGDRRQLFSENMEFEAEFRNTSGLAPGSKVLVGGFNAGEVTEIVAPSAPEGGFVVRFRVLKKLHPILRTDSLAKIQLDGLVGNRLLRVEAGTSSGAPLDSGDRIPSEEPIELSHVFHETLETIADARGVIAEVKGNAAGLMQEIEDISHNVDGLITDVGEDVRGITASGEQIAADVSVVVANTRKGKGTVGLLLTDESLYDDIARAAGSVGDTAANAEDVSEDVKTIVSGMKSRDLAGKVTRTAENIEGITGHGKNLMESIAGEDGQESLGQNLRNAVGNADEALIDLAENMESLKRNWFFRGFFKKRGFYDLDLVSPEEYRAGEFAPKHSRLRRWFHASEIFVTAPDGSDKLSAAGREALQQAVGDLLPVMGEDPLIVEGYSSEGSKQQQFLHSRRRARAVQSHLVRKYRLKPSYVGAMPMGGVPSSGPDRKLWDGVALVLFVPEPDLPAPRRFKLHPGVKR